jgi:histidinol-phosphatase (PHP family)
LLLPDYHTHTARCGHAVGSAADYVDAARRRGLPAIGVADHLPLLPDPDPELTMPIDELSAYVEEVLALKRCFPGYVLLGIEADYRPDTVDRVADLLASYPFDYVIGSVHFLGEWGFDDPRRLAGLAERSVEEIYTEYFELVGQAAETGLFTIMGHLDLVKKFGHRPERPLTQAVDELAARLTRAGVTAEINTAGLRRPVREMYPAADVLQALQRHGVQITFGSDAHAPTEVGTDFALAAAFARDCGFSHYVSFTADPLGGRATPELRALDASAHRC